MKLKLGGQEAKCLISVGFYIGKHAQEVFLAVYYHIGRSMHLAKGEEVPHVRVVSWIFILNVVT